MIRVEMKVVEADGGYDSVISLNGAQIQCSSFFKARGEATSAITMVRWALLNVGDLLGLNAEEDRESLAIEISAA